MTNACSKKVENHCHALALYFIWHNFCRQKAHRLSPAIAAGISHRLFDKLAAIELSVVAQR